MDIENMSLSQLKRIINLFDNSVNENNQIGKDFIGEFVVIRTYSAGVHIGTLKERNGTEVILENTRRIWSWSGAFTLSGVAIDGIEKSSKLSKKLAYILLTQVIEIIPASDKAIKIFNSIEDHNP